MAKEREKTFTEKLQTRLEVHEQMNNQGFQMVIIPTCAAQIRGEKERTIWVPPSRTKGK